MEAQELRGVFESGNVNTNSAKLMYTLIAPDSDRFWGQTFIFRILLSGGRGTHTPIHTNRGFPPSLTLGSGFRSWSLRSRTLLTCETNDSPPKGRPACVLRIPNLASRAKRRVESFHSNAEEGEDMTRRDGGPPLPDDHPVRRLWKSKQDGMPPLPEDHPVYQHFKSKRDGTPPLPDDHPVSKSWRKRKR